MWVGITAYSYARNVPIAFKLALLNITKRVNCFIRIRANRAVENHSVMPRRTRLTPSNMKVVEKRTICIRLERRTRPWYSGKLTKQRELQVELYQDRKKDSLA